MDIFIGRVIVLDYYIPGCIVMNAYIYFLYFKAIVHEKGLNVKKLCVPALSVSISIIQWPPEQL